MVNYTNFGNNSNVTGFASAFDQAGHVVQLQTGMDIFAPTVLVVFFLMAYIVGSKYTQERAFVFSLFVTTGIAWMMVSGGLLAPAALIVCGLLLLAAVFIGNRVG